MADDDLTCWWNDGIAVLCVQVVVGNRLFPGLYFRQFQAVKGAVAGLSGSFFAKCDYKDWWARGV